MAWMLSECAPLIHAGYPRHKIPKTKQRRKALILATIFTFSFLRINFTVTPSGSIYKSASAEAPTGSVPQPQTLTSFGQADPVRRTIAATQGWAEPTAALRAAVWAATAVIVAASVAVAFAADQAQRYRRPARTGSARWEAGWAGQVKGARAAYDSG
jgi:hypothetical protein